MVVEPSCNADSVTSMLKQHVGGVEFQRSHGKELAFTIPVSEVTHFASELVICLHVLDGERGDNISISLEIQMKGNIAEYGLG